MAVDEHGLANDIARCGEARFPIVVAEDEDGIGVLGGVVLQSEQPAQGGLESEQLEVVAGDDFGVFVLCLVVPTDADAGAVGGQHPGKDLVLVAQILVHGIGEVVVSIAAKAAGRAGEVAGPLEANQLFGPLDGQHAQQHLVEESEDRGIGADAEGKSEQSR